jgi:hypothetical protein
VPDGAEGFTVLAPGSAVVDLGTEFGFNVGPDGRAELMVFEGQAEVSVLDGEGHTLRSALLEEKHSVRVDPAAGRIREEALSPDSFVAAPELVCPTLALDAAYADAVRRAAPWGYWRFEALDGGAVPNEVAGGPALRAAGPLALAGAPGENRSVVFAPKQPEQALVLDGTWAPPRDQGFAVELWLLSERFRLSALVGLVADAKGRAERHVSLIELLGRSHALLYEPCTVRFLDRWPPGSTGGGNVFSTCRYVPYRWHHLVAQKAGDRLELYIDGEPAGVGQVESGAGTAPCRLLLGRLKQSPDTLPNQVRPFVGRLDELAVYDRPLTLEEIRRHRELGAPAR